MLKCANISLHLLLELNESLNDAVHGAIYPTSILYHRSIKCETMYSLRSELERFFSALHTQQQNTSSTSVQLMTSLAALSEEEIEVLLRTILRNYYCVMILFIVRTIIRTFFQLSVDDYQLCTDWAKQHGNSVESWHSDMYRPMIIELASEKLTFTNIEIALKLRISSTHNMSLQNHYRRAAGLIPVSKSVPILAHVQYYFGLFTSKG